jgi:hypothetical protein
MRLAVLVMALLVGSAHADSKQPMKLTLGADGTLALRTGLIQEDISPRVELSPVAHHSFVLRAGVGQASPIEGEVDLPDHYSHRDVAVGYRLGDEHVYVGLEAGCEWFRAHGGENPPMQGYTWFARNFVTLMIGGKMGPVSAGLDIEPRGRIGVHVGVDLVRFSL